MLTDLCHFLASGRQKTSPLTRSSSVITVVFMLFSTSQSSLKIFDRYLTPESGKTVTMTEPSLIDPDKTRAAWRFSPAEPPISRPSLAATSLHVRKFCSSVVRMIPLTTVSSKQPGMLSLPTPSVYQLFFTLTSSAGTLFAMWSQNTEPSGSATST